jgi:hypothetical protein
MRNKERAWKTWSRANRLSSTYCISHCCKRTAQRPLHHSSRSLCYSSLHPLGCGWHHLQHSLDRTSQTLGSWSLLPWLIERTKLRSLHPSSMCTLSTTHAAEAVYTRRALSSTIPNSHQEPVSGQAYNLPDLHFFFFSGYSLSVMLCWCSFELADSFLNLRL